MKARLFAATGLAAIALGGAAAWMVWVQPITRAEEAVRRELKDPGSAQFENVTVFAGGAACGRVNAKNGFGGYDGFRDFVLYPNGGVQLLPTAQDEDVKQSARLIREVHCRDK